ncbi:MAG: hypothetical protein K0S70_140 [Microbacterium sp.]|jgi:hypothetical protein|nr:hypothetical protein [Microbacterium sp.]
MSVIDFTRGVTNLLTVEVRSLEIPIHPDELHLGVLSGQTIAKAKSLRVIEREARSTMPDPRKAGYYERSHDPFVRLYLDRFRKDGYKTRTGAQFVDIHTLADWAEDPRRNERWGPEAARVFDLPTVQTLATLSTQALATFRQVDWARGRIALVRLEADS